MKPKSLYKLIYELWSFLSPRRQIQFYLFFILMIVSSIMELFSIGAVIPFLSVLTNPEIVFEIKILKPLIEFLGFANAKELVLPITILFAIAALTSGATRMLLVYVTTKLSYIAGAEISLDIYRKTLYQPYKSHLTRNSSEVVSGVISKANSLTGAVIQPVLTILSTIFISGTVLIALISYKPIVAFSILTSCSILYLAVAKYSQNRLLRNSEIVAREQVNMIKALTEALGGIRDVILDRTQDYFCEVYRKSDLPLRIASAHNTYMMYSPRFTLEALGIVLLAIFAYILSLSDVGLGTSAIPLLGSIALGAQRMLPVIQGGYASWATLRSSNSTLLDVLVFLNQPMPEYMTIPVNRPMSFHNNIKLKNLSFTYGEGLPYVLKNIDFEIKKGFRVGFIGKTGSGKSTLLDIIMGLLEPSDGKILIDDAELMNSNLRSWQANIAHVPQSIYLSDNSILENIAFGIPKVEIDVDRVKQAASQAQLSEHIESLENGYSTYVGERGIRLSGGQRQRIGIARALYKKASVIIFDEATSALDNETEKEVMSAIEKLGKNLTILIIAHRLTTVKSCDLILELNNGTIIRSGKYSDLFK